MNLNELKLMNHLKITLSDTLSSDQIQTLVSKINQNKITRHLFENFLKDKNEMNPDTSTTAEQNILHPQIERVAKMGNYEKQ